MLRLKQSGFVWSLLLCLVLVNGLLAVPAVAHTDHHAKHEAGTHSTGLCAWECAAGQSIDSPSVYLESTLQPCGRATSAVVCKVYQLSPLCPLLRGPPILIL